MSSAAVSTAACAGQPPFRFRVAGRAAAGDPAMASAEDSIVAIRILTGAAVPAAFDAVVMQEQCDLDGDAVPIQRRPSLGDNIRRAGEDVPRGRVIVTAGATIDARHVAILAAAGFATIEVKRRITVALLSTGTELRQPGETLAHGQIYDSNRIMLRGFLQRPFIQADDFGAVSDDPHRLEATLRRAAARAEVIVSSGGVSVGDEDHMHRLLLQAGGTLEVMKVAIKPGKPVTVGRLGKAVYLGLPGNPVSAFVTVAPFGRLVIGKRAGQTMRPPAAQPAICENDRTRSTGRQEYLPAQIVRLTAEGEDPHTGRFGGAVCSGFCEWLYRDSTQQGQIRKDERVTFIPMAELL